MSQSKKKAAAVPNDGGEDDDDVAALIYRESQLRKAEAAAAAAESKKTSSAASSRNRTSARKRLPVNNQGEELSPSLLCKGDSKRLHWRKVGLKKGGPKRSTTDMNALLMDVQTQTSKEEYALGTGQRSKDVAVKDAQVMS